MPCSREMLSTRRNCEYQFVHGRAIGWVTAPPSLTRTVRYRFQTGSSPRLSYTPPSVRNRHLVNPGTESVVASPHELMAVLAGLTLTGDSNGGKPADAATASVSFRSGLAHLPTRQSAAYSFA